jgi:hypothetical protein
MISTVPASVSFHPSLRISARIISYLFHPLFVPLYVAWFLIYEVRSFPDRSEWQKTIIMIQFFVYYTFLPLVTTFLCKALGFISSIHLNSQKDRIIPYVVCEIFYFWAWYVFRNLHFPAMFVVFSLGVFLATSLGLIINTAMKVSMHALSVGVLSAFIFIASLRTDLNYGLYISIAILMAGMTGTARLIDSNHTTKEVYFGFFAGVASQVIAYFFV